MVWVNVAKNARKSCRVWDGQRLFRPKYKVRNCPQFAENKKKKNRLSRVCGSMRMVGVREQSRLACYRAKKIKTCMLFFSLDSGTNLGSSRESAIHLSNPSDCSSSCSS